MIMYTQSFTMQSYNVNPINWSSYVFMVVVRTHVKCTYKTIQKTVSFENCKLKTPR